MITSDFTIEIKPSKDFLKIGLLLHLLAIIILINSSLTWWFISLNTCILSITYFIFWYKNWCSEQRVSRRAGVWVVETAGKPALVYEQLSFDFEGGFYFYLKLSTGEEIQKRLLVFKDQLTRAEERLLRIVTTIIHNKV